MSGLQLKIISIMINHENYQQVNRLITHSIIVNIVKRAHHSFTRCKVTQT